MTQTSTHWRLYGHWSDRVGAWWGVYRNFLAARTHAGQAPVVALDACAVETPSETPPETNDGVYWGWLTDADATPSLVYPTWRHFEMCFPGGSDAAQAHGGGRVIALALAEAPDPTTDPTSDPTSDAGTDG